MSEVTTTTAKEKVKVSIPEILAMLEKGLDRKAIKTALGLSHADMGKLFRLPQLANRKPIKEAGFILTDETGNAIEMPALVAKKTRTKKVKGEVATGTVVNEASVDKTESNLNPPVQEIGTAQVVETENW